MIAIDSNIFIYWLEQNQEFYETSARIIKQIYSGDTQATCSTLVLTEIYSSSKLANEAILKLPNLSIVAPTQSVAELAGRLRYAHGLKVIDAIHAATAIASGADTLITNDRAFSKKKIPDLSIVLLTTWPAS